MELQNLSFSSEFLMANFYLFLIYFINIYFSVYASNKHNTEEGVMALANLPKLEVLTLCFSDDSNRWKSNRVFEHFRTLKKVSCTRLGNMKEGVRDLLRNCSNFQEISLDGYSGEEIIEIYKCAAESLKQRNNNDSSLLLSSGFYYVTNLNDLKVRMVPIRSEKDSTKIFFQIFYDMKSFKPDCSTDDLDIFIKEATLLMKLNR